MMIAVDRRPGTCERRSALYVLMTRSQAVARIADLTASQHLWRSHDVIGYVTI